MMARIPLSAEFNAILWTWYEAKHLFEGSVAFSSDAIHVFVGVPIQLAAAFLLRRSVASWRPWGIVFLLITFNEFIDLYLERWPVRAEQYGEGIRDFILTLTLPTILLIACRTWPRLFAAR